MDNEFKKIMSSFPKFGLSYEMSSHGKEFQDQYDFAMAIPLCRGKHMCWLTTMDGKKVSIVMELNKDRVPTCLHFVESFETSSEHYRGTGTILYGSLVNETLKGGGVEKPQFFIIEDVYHYKGHDVSKIIYATKYYYISNMLTEMTYQTNNIVFSVPVSWTIPKNTNENMIYTLFDRIYRSKCAYEVHHVQVRSLMYIMPILRITANEKETVTHQPVFLMKPHIRKSLGMTEQYGHITPLLVKADIMFDVYHVYAYSKHGYEYMGQAHVPTLELSTKLNQLFRKKLDYETIEFSDDEEEDDVDECRFMKHTQYVMNCVYMSKYKKWMPLQVSEYKRPVDIRTLTQSYNQ